MELSLDSVEDIFTPIFKINRFDSVSPNYVPTPGPVKFKTPCSPDTPVLWTFLLAQGAQSSHCKLQLTAIQLDVCYQGSDPNSPKLNGFTWIHHYSPPKTLTSPGRLTQYRISACTPCGQLQLSHSLTDNS